MTGFFEAVKESLEGRREPVMESLDYLPKHLTRRLGSRTGSYSSYLKIAEGCNKRCTYCIIPYLRGNYRSVPMEELLEEASMLAEQGTKRTDRDRAGDHRIWCGYLWREETAAAAGKTV